MTIGLNTLRDEAGHFVQELGNSAYTDAEAILCEFDNEVAALRSCLATPSALQHQIYDALFLLFELAARYDLDLDAEWTKGRERKRVRYLQSSGAETGGQCGTD